MPKTIPRMEIYKMKVFAKTLQRFGGNITEACEYLGISRDTAHRWINNSRDLRKLLERLRSYEPNEEDRSRELSRNH